jgi:hypothetical protein
MLTGLSHIRLTPVLTSWLSEHLYYISASFWFVLRITFLESVIVHYVRVDLLFIFAIEIVECVG